MNYERLFPENKRIHTTLIDPFNELSHDFSKDEGRQDLYIERILGDVRKNARKTILEKLFTMPQNDCIIYTSIGMIL